MLTIMQKQAKMMEGELKNKKQALLEARASLQRVPAVLASPATHATWTQLPAQEAVSEALL